MAYITRDLALTPLSAELAAFLAQREPKGELVVGCLPTLAREAIGAKSADVWMNASFVEKQLHKRAELPVMTYALIPDLLANPAVILDQGDRRLLLLTRSGEIWSAAVKTTRDGARNYILNFRRSSIEDLRRLARRDRIIYGEMEHLGC